MNRASGGPARSTSTKRSVCSAITNDRSTLLDAAMMAKNFPGYVVLEEGTFGTVWGKR